MSIKLTTVAGTQAKRIIPFIATIWNFFDSSNEVQIREALLKVSLLARRGKLKTIYMFETIAGVTVNREFDGLSTAIELNVKCDKTVQCDECITLHFPSIEQVLLYEKLANEDRELYTNNHSEFLDKYVDELLCCK